MAAACDVCVSDYGHRNGCCTDIHLAHITYIHVLYVMRIHIFKAQVGDIKLTQNIRTGVLHHDDIMQKIPRAEISEIAQEILVEARKVGGQHVELTVCGSYRCVCSL